MGGMGATGGHTVGVFGWQALGAIGHNPPRAFKVLFVLGMFLGMSPESRTSGAQYLRGL